jgi:hypothetical protein
MMRRRTAGRRIARAAVGTAVVAGTAGAVHHHQDKKWSQKEAQQQAQYNQAYQQGAYDAQQSAPPPQQSAPPPQQYAAPAQDDLTAKLQQLADLHKSGVLTDQEFTAAKQKLLTGS